MDTEQRSRAALEVAEQLVAARAVVTALEARFHALIAGGDALPLPSAPEPEPAANHSPPTSFPQPTKLATLRAEADAMQANITELDRIAGHGAKTHKVSADRVLAALRASDNGLRPRDIEAVTNDCPSTVSVALIRLRAEGKAEQRRRGWWIAVDADPAPRVVKMGRRSRYDDATLARIVALYAENKSEREICLELQIPPSSLYRLVVQMRASGAIAPRRPGGKPALASPEISRPPVDLPGSRPISETTVSTKISRPPANAARTAARPTPAPAAPPSNVDVGVIAIIRAHDCLGRMSPKGRITHDQVLDLHLSIEVLEIESWRLALEFEESAIATRRAIHRYADELSATGSRALGEQTHDADKADALRRGAAMPKGPTITKVLRALDLDRDLMRGLVAEIEAARYKVAAPLRECYDAATRLRERFVAANMGMVHSIARKYVWSTTPFADLMQEGVLGLMHAIPRFDRDKGFKFSTYATNWIRHEIGRHLENCGENVRLPVHARASLRKLNAARNKLRTQYGRDPSHAELSAETKIDAAVIRKLGTVIVGEAHMTAEASDRVFARVADVSVSAPDALIAIEDREILHAAVAKLPARHREIIERRFGLNGAPEGRTLGEVGHDYDLSRERIRQLETAALKRLRALLERPASAY